MEAHRRTYFTRRGLALTRPTASGPALPKGARALDSTRTSSLPAQGAAQGAAQGSSQYAELDLIAGEMHYFRLDPRDWRPCLETMRDRCGVALVSTCAPWCLHEIRAGRFDWQGEFDLGRFLDLIGELGMRALIRPGPYVGAELTYFGLPGRVLRKSEVMAMTSRDTPAWLPAPTRMFPVPSYASRAFQGEVRGWFAALAEVVAPRLCPDGPVVAVQVDSGAPLSYRRGAYDLDYHPDALSWWREFSGDRPAPRGWSEEAAGDCVRWVAFKDEYTARSRTWLGEALDDAGLFGLARYHSAPPSDPHWLASPRASRASDLAGLNFHDNPRDYQAVRRRALYLASTGKPVPFAPEVGMGGSAWLLPMTSPAAPDEQRAVLLTLLAAGVRGFNLHMMVERERWYGGVIDTIGDLRAEFSWLPALVEALTNVGFSGLRRWAPVALMVSRADARFALATSVVDPLSPMIGELLGLGPAGAAELAEDESGRRYRRFLAACEQALDLAQVPYDIVDEGVEIDKLAGYRAVIAPTLGRVDRGAWQRLHEAAGRGVQVVIGPERPKFDQYGDELGADAGLPERTGLIQAASLDDVSGLADDLLAVAGDLPEEWSAEEDCIDCSLFVSPGADAGEGEKERPAVFFVGNRAGQAVNASLLVVSKVVLMDPLADESFTADDDGAVTVPMGGYRVRMLIVNTCGQSAKTPPGCAR